MWVQCESLGLSLVSIYCGDSRVEQSQSLMWYRKLYRVCGYKPDYSPYLFPSYIPHWSDIPHSQSQLPLQELCQTHARVLSDARLALHLPATLELVDGECTKWPHMSILQVARRTMFHGWPGHHVFSCRHQPKAQLQGWALLICLWGSLEYTIKERFLWCFLVSLICVLF